VLALGVVVALAGGAYLVSEYTRRPPTRDGAPSWSPDSRQIAFYAEQAGGTADVFVLDLDSGATDPLFTSPDADEGAPAFSPDGTRIAYDSDVSGNFEIYVMPRGNRTATRLTQHPARDLAPDWSPDGRHIVFMSDRDAKPEFDVYRMRADGSEVERLTQGATHWFPQYSPDGTKLAMHVWRDVHVLDLATRRLRRLTTDPQNGMYPTWSPDGQRIAFMSWRNGPTEIFTMNADGSDQQMLVRMPRGSAIDPRWSPDGKFIVFVHVPEESVHGAQSAAQSRILYTVELASGRLRRLSR
jgi:TolB protein